MHRPVPRQKTEYQANLAGAAVKTPRNTVAKLHNRGAEVKQFSLDGRVFGSPAGQGNNRGAAGIAVGENGAGYIAVQKRGAR